MVLGAHLMHQIYEWELLQKRVNLIPQLNQADMIEISTEEEMSKFEVKFE